MENTNYKWVKIISIQMFRDSINFIKDSSSINQKPCGEVCTLIVPAIWPMTCGRYSFTLSTPILAKLDVKSF